MNPAGWEAAVMAASNRQLPRAVDRQQKSWSIVVKAGGFHILPVLTHRNIDTGIQKIAHDAERSLVAIPLLLIFVSKKDIKAHKVPDEKLL